MNKLKIMIVYNNDKGIEKIKNAVKNIEYLEIVGSTKNGKEVYNKIIELKPDIIFTKFKMKDYDSMETMLNLGEKCPKVKYLADNLEIDEDKEFYKKIKDKNSIRFNFVRELGINEIIKEIEEYYQTINNIT